MSREDLHFRLRIPPDLKNKIEAAATASHRSMTAEIVARLESTFGHPEAATTSIGASLLAVVDALSDRDIVMLQFATKRLRDRRKKAAHLMDTEKVEKSKPK
ncbi:Arc family DNA-binding protein [Zavarzinia aquatilis]|uniref:Arc-like DNA binding domain-containing protein n=1 Tax=Zavarzinia aquatilis TaxID=2211142 RepID=A0A317EE84_9PROT|nr:Arc family DNA-binding protein [Zavarzinia aquatilis]PWR24576.1 hypothetical protein DKG74_07160 [Zavarzinia aquatilis]